MREEHMACLLFITYLKWWQLDSKLQIYRKIKAREVAWYSGGEMLNWETSVLRFFHYKNNTCMQQKVQKGIQRSVILPPTPDPLPLTSRSSFLCILLEICQVTDRHTQTHPQMLSVVEIGTCSPHCSTPSFLTLQYISDLSKSACQRVNFIPFSGCISTVCFHLQNTF